MFIWWTNQFWAMSLDLIWFFDFLKLFVNMHLKLRTLSISENFQNFLRKWTERNASTLQKYKFYKFWTYRSKVMEVWNLLEKFGQSGLVLKSTTKSWPHVQEKVGRRKKENFAKRGGLGYPCKVGGWLLVADWLLPAICLTVGNFLQTPLISNFLGFFFFNF